ncbi:MAG: hypothetical protein A2Y84_00175 [Candidatus Colwellbacteria bacterium RBG_13_48_8]|uniref:SHS2 domain-containing protein n=1 Tax=Candidatus Colwellbacteria bacterium RBG_13_48_8 TaxID=1797685 RepID=A0A1G1YXV5_9BACT|nr:MAG: hypothetical protein A2Y84_00175 [Candidatus Colwellbacteria bacterium RBG_13_48_8]
MGINVRRAEELKRQNGLLGKGGEYEISTLMLPYLDVILNEAKRVRESYERSHQDRVERVILAGGGANLLGIEKYAADQLQLPVIKADPFSPLVGYGQNLMPIVKDIGPIFSVALGLGIKILSSQ